MARLFLKSEHLLPRVLKETGQETSRLSYSSNCLLCLYSRLQLVWKTEPVRFSGSRTKAGNRLAKIWEQRPPREIMSQQEIQP